MVEWLECMTHYLTVADWNISRSCIFANSRLIYSFLIAFYKVAFCRVLASVGKAKLRLCVNKAIGSF